MRVCVESGTAEFGERKDTNRIYNASESIPQKQLFLLRELSSVHWRLAALGKTKSRL